MWTFETHGRRIRDLLSECDSTAVIISPFIKTKAFGYLMDSVPARCQLKCVTRWLPKEVAAGVSDPGILSMVETRGNAEVYLVDNLHAKLYIADGRCLVGSSNVTLAGLGEAGDSNIEVLVESTVDDPGVAATLAEIGNEERRATREMANVLEDMVQSLEDLPGSVRVDGWIPKSFRAQDAYRVYSKPAQGYVTKADRILLADTAGADCQPGLEEAAFERRIRDRLSEIPFLKAFLGEDGDSMLRCVDVYDELEKYATDDYSVETLWRALVSWTTHFLRDRIIGQEVAEMALRRGKLVG